MHGKVVALVAAALGVVACGPAWAGWPDDKPIEVVIGFAPGGATDVMARKLLPFVEQRLGGKVKFVVLNKPGAGGEIAFAAIARAAPDAYAIGVVNVPGYDFIPMTRKTQYSMDEIRLIARVVMCSRRRSRRLRPTRRREKNGELNQAGMLGAQTKNPDIVSLSRATLC